jgi:hypothetical protein
MLDLKKRPSAVRSLLSLDECTGACEFVIGQSAPLRPEALAWQAVVAQLAQAAGDVHPVSFNRGDVLGDSHAVDEPVAAADDHRPEGLGAGAVAVPGAREAHAGQVERVAEPCPVAQPEGDAAVTSAQLRDHLWLGRHAGVRGYH